MNIPATVRLNQLATNLTRLKGLAAKLPQRFVMVNIPAAQVEAVEQGQVVSRHTAIVGKVDRPSPMVNSKIYEINFNPVLDGAGEHHQAGPDPEDARPIPVHHQVPHPHLQPAGQRAFARPDRLEQRRGDQVHVSRGPGRHQFARPGQDKLLQQGRRVHARHADQGPVQQRVPLRLLGMRAHPEHSRADHLAAAGYARLEPRDDRRRCSRTASASM